MDIGNGCRSFGRLSESPMDPADCTVDGWMDGWSREERGRRKHKPPNLTTRPPDIRRLLLLPTSPLVSRSALPAGPNATPAEPRRIKKLDFHNLWGRGVKSSIRHNPARSPAAASASCTALHHCTRLNACATSLTWQEPLGALSSWEQLQ
ncbi:hypothetical protein BKA80DRAFT_256861 [Phyllosticta citrichinensis]